MRTLQQYSTPIAMRPQTGYSISRRIYFENKYFKEPEKYKLFYCFARCTRLGALSEIAIEINHLHIHRAHKSQNCVRVVLRVKYLQLLVLKITATSLQITQAETFNTFDDVEFLPQKPLLVKIYNLQQHCISRNESISNHYISYDTHDFAAHSRRPQCGIQQLRQFYWFNALALTQTVSSYYFISSQNKNLHSMGTFCDLVLIDSTEIAKLKKSLEKIRRIVLRTKHI